jgi:hypothetical protein
MAGLTMTAEERAAQIRALIDERSQYERRALGATSDEDRERWQDRVEQVREQLRARGAEGEPPRERAAKRTRVPAEGVEVR